MNPKERQGNEPLAELVRQMRRQPRPPLEETMDKFEERMIGVIHKELGEQNHIALIVMGHLVEMETASGFLTDEEKRQINAIRDRIESTLAPWVNDSENLEFTRNLWEHFQETDTDRELAGKKPEEEAFF